VVACTQTTTEEKKIATTAKYIYGTQTSFTITGTSLADTSGRISTQVDLDSGSNEKIPIAVEIQVQVQVADTTTWTAGEPISVWLATGDDNSIMDSGQSLTDATIATGATPGAQEVTADMRHLHTFVGYGDTDEARKKHIFVPNPGRRISLYVLNDSGQALHATAATALTAKYTPIYLDIT
jgi:hypothetical protein